ncbi:MAG: amidase family protein, partial [Actinomycetota bacterium]
VAANLAVAALGTETNGSIVCPSSVNGLVGIKPTVGLTSRAGVVPISHSQDTVGPMARTVADAAAVLSAIVGVDERDPATGVGAGHGHDDYTEFLDPNGLQGARLGVARQLLGRRGPTITLFEATLARLADLGAELVDPVEFPSHDELVRDRPDRSVLLSEIRTDLAAYLATRRGGPRTLAELIDFNHEHAERELAWFGQELFEMAEERGGTDHPDYPEELARAKRLAGPEGLEAVLAGGRTEPGLDHAPLDAIVAPTGGPAWPIDAVNGDPGSGWGSSLYAAVAGTPLITVPMGHIAGLPVGLTFMGRAWSEPTLIRLASGFEAATAARRPPQFLSTLGLGVASG